MHLHNALFLYISMLYMKFHIRQAQMMKTKRTIMKSSKPRGKKAHKNKNHEPNTTEKGSYSGGNSERKSSFSEAMNFIYSGLSWENVPENPNYKGKFCPIRTLGMIDRPKLKLLVDSKANKVVFAEAGKHFVDFLFHMFSLPLGKVVKLLSTKDMVVGALGDLSESIGGLDSAHLLQPDVSKDSVLQPQVTTSVEPPVFNFNWLLDNNYSNTNEYLFKGSGKGGYVKGLVTYIVFDNLEVMPMSTMSCITLVNKFHVDNIASLHARDIYLSLDQGVALLKASLQTKNVLSTVFL